MSTLNMVKFRFMISASSQTIRQYIAITYQTASEQKIYPKDILVRSAVHPSTSINRRYQQNPKGKHLTLCFKDQGIVERETHVASPGYVTNSADWNIREATHSPEKPDSTTTRRGLQVWPKDRPFEYEIGIAYGHLPDESELK
ncbi:hypothetical protein BJY01DRAFT_239233 [Aspergillus pseudoustus]|uniref:Uncharacterized protein n=1 Tax=Aspergillus pseudoustus TaxID=1810923 RepID=A0ABR4J2A0_9EURO